MSKLFLGIDGGQTVTKCVLADTSGQILGLGVGGASVHIKDEATQRQVRKALHTALSQALKAAGISIHSPIESAFMGFSGVSGPRASGACNYCQALRERFSVRFLMIDHDARIALAGAIPDSVGVIAIAGTGSIAFGMDAKQRSARAGGWGYLLGDPGSAYEIGRRGLKAVGDAYDGLGPRTLLTPSILEVLGLEDECGITDAVYRDGQPKLRIASIATVVATAAQKGDAVARKILEEGGKRLGAMACAVARKLQIPERSLKFSAVGGVFQAGAQLWNPYRRFVLSRYPLAMAAPPAFPPVIGALILAYTRCNIRLSSRRLDNLLRNSQKMQTTAAVRAAID